MNFLVGRQAILDKNGHTFGYELLYRESMETNNSATTAVNGNEATNRVIVNAFINMGIDKIAKYGRVFINFTKDLIVQKIYEALPKDKIVIEVLEDVMAEPEVLESLKNAKKEGYIIALDDFVFLDHLKELVELADIIKVDFMELNRKDIEHQVEMYKPYKLKLLAEKVENKDEFQFAINLGFNYFQGFFFQKPTIEAKKDIAPYQASILKAIGIVNDAKSEIEDLTELVSGDLYLHTKMLAFVNSPFFGLKRKIGSVKSAVNILGLNRVKEWLNIMYVAKLAENRPEELIVLSTVRAKFASFLSQYFSVDDNDAYFLGMFSLMDSILNLPMEVILEEFAYINQDIIDALLGKKNKYRTMFNFIRMFESGDFDNAYKIIKNSPSDIENVNNYYFKAIEFADNIYGS